jgi:peptide deformylase
MARLMYASNGCGIAAPQVGIGKQLMIVDISEPQEDESPTRAQRNPIFFVNPRVIRSWGEMEAGDEGCLSIPGITISIKRPTGILVTAQDLQGEQFEIEAEGFFARAILHEMDHLNGTTMFEHVDPITRAKVFREYEEALRLGAKPGDVATLDEHREAARASAGMQVGAGTQASVGTQVSSGDTAKPGKTSQDRAID